MRLEYLIELDNIKVKDYLKEKGISRNLGRKIKLYGKMYVNNEEVVNYYILKKGDLLLIEYEESKNESFIESNEELDIVFEDQYFLVLNKPINISCQPSRSHSKDNIINRIQYYFNKNNITTNIHLVNRLDFSTSGLMIVAKNGYIHNELKKIFIERKYLAKVEKPLPEKMGKICLPIARENEYSIKRKVDESGKSAITYYNMIDDKNYIVELKLETGRTHQIRVHLSYLGSSIIGDKLYGNGADEMYLHCYYLEFIHPITKQKVNLIKYPVWFGG